MSLSYFLHNGFAKVWNKVISFLAEYMKNIKSLTSIPKNLCSCLQLMIMIFVKENYFK